MMRQRSRRSGNATIEMTLIGIPIIFVLISIFEISRGMWMYHTMAYAVKEATRFAIVHGQNCLPPSTNACSVTVANVAQVLKDAGVGLDPDQTTVDFNPSGGTTAGATLTNCLTNNNVWPPTGTNGRGQPVTITIRTPFRSALAMFWPGAGSVRFAPVFNFSAASTEVIQF